MINGPGAMQQAVAARQTQIGGDWFFWIAGISALSTILALAGQHFYFALGLGTTQFIDGLAANGTGPNSPAFGKGAAIAASLAAAAFYALYGVFARKGALWAFIVGAVFYILDGLLLVVFKEWISVAFHAYALFRIFQGFQAAQQLAVLRKQSAGFAATGYVPPSSNPSNDVWPPPPSA